MQSTLDNLKLMGTNLSRVQNNNRSDNQEGGRKNIQMIKEQVNFLADTWWRSIIKMSTTVLTRLPL